MHGLKKLRRNNKPKQKACKTQAKEKENHMKRIETVVVALMAFIGLLVATGSALGQTLTCTENVEYDQTTGKFVNWHRQYVYTVNGEKRLAYDPDMARKEKHADSYPLGYYFAGSSDSPTGDTLEGTNSVFKFARQCDGVQMQVHYEGPGGVWWWISENSISSDGNFQLAKCPKMVVPKGYQISFVVRAKVEPWVPDGAMIDGSLLGISGFKGTTFGRIPDYKILTYTGPWLYKWWKPQAAFKVRLLDSRNCRPFAIINAPPSSAVNGGWFLEYTTNLKQWLKVKPLNIVSVGTGYDYLEVPIDMDLAYEFFRFVKDP
jgi:hypothetical protein